MVEAPLQSRSDGQDRHLLLYDGACGLCSRLVRFVLTRDRDRVFDFASLQSAVGKAMVARAGVTGDELTTFYVFPNYRAAQLTALTKSRATLFVAGALGRPWKSAAIFGVLPAAWLDRIYDIVARNRDRVFGRQEQCLVPPAEHRHRFV